MALHAKGLGLRPRHTCFGVATERGDVMSTEDSTGEAQPRRVLLVEDSELVARSLVRMFRDTPYAPVVAQSAAAALELLGERGAGQSGFCVALVDKGLPDGDGLRLAREIRGSHGVPVAVISGDLAPYGEDLPWLMKPFRPHELHALLGQLDSEAGRQG